jgi:hypothetical protein
VVGAAVAAIVALFATGALMSRHREPGDGPLEGTTGLSYGGPSPIGRPESYGASLLLNHGKAPAVVERARLLDVVGGLELVGVLARPVPDPNGKGLMIGELVYPPVENPSEPLHQLHVVPVPTEFSQTGDPENGLQIVFGVRTTRPGVAGARAVEITYRVGNHRYKETYDQKLYLCAPEAEYISSSIARDGKKPCPGPEPPKSSRALG